MRERNFIKMARLSKKMTQCELSRKTGIKQPRIYI